MEAAKATRGAVRVRSDVEGVEGTKPSACGELRAMMRHACLHKILNLFLYVYLFL